MQLNLDSFCDSVQAWMEVIGYLWAEFLIFLRKEGQNAGGRGHFKGADILTGRAGTTSRASTAETPPI